MRKILYTSLALAGIGAVAAGSVAIDREFFNPAPLGVAITEDRKIELLLKEKFSKLSDKELAQHYNDFFMKYGEWIGNVESARGLSGAEYLVHVESTIDHIAEGDVQVKPLLGEIKRRHGKFQDDFRMSTTSPDVTYRSNLHEDHLPKFYDP